jgi:hypothetical protein
MTRVTKHIRDIKSATLLTGQEKDEIHAKFISQYFSKWGKGKGSARFNFEKRHEHRYAVTFDIFKSNLFNKSRSLLLFACTGYQKFEIWRGTPDVFNNYLFIEKALERETDLYIMPENWAWIIQTQDEWADNDYRYTSLDIDYPAEDISGDFIKGEYLVKQPRYSEYQKPPRKERYQNRQQSKE